MVRVRVRKQARERTRATASAWVKARARAIAMALKSKGNSESEGEVPSFDDTPDILAVPLHVNLQLLCLTGLGQHGQGGGGRLAVP